MNEQPHQSRSVNINRRTTQHTVLLQTRAEMPAAAAESLQRKLSHCKGASVQQQSSKAGAHTLQQLLTPFLGHHPSTPCIGHLSAPVIVHHKQVYHDDPIRNNVSSNFYKASKPEKKQEKKNSQATIHTLFRFIDVQVDALAAKNVQKQELTCNSINCNATHCSQPSHRALDRKRLETQHAPLPQTYRASKKFDNIYKESIQNLWGTCR